MLYGETSSPWLRAPTEYWAQKAHNIFSDESAPCVCASMMTPEHFPILVIGCCPNSKKSRKGGRGGAHRGEIPVKLLFKGTVHRQNQRHIFLPLAVALFFYSDCFRGSCQAFKIALGSPCQHDTFLKNTTVRACFCWKQGGDVTKNSVLSLQFPREANFSQRD